MIRSKVFVLERAVDFIRRLFRDMKIRGQSELNE